MIQKTLTFDLTDQTSTKLSLPYQSQPWFPIQNVIVRHVGWQKVFKDSWRKSKPRKLCHTNNWDASKSCGMKKLRETTSENVQEHRGYCQEVSVEKDPHLHQSKRTNSKNIKDEKNRKKNVNLRLWLNSLKKEKFRETTNWWAIDPWRLKKFRETISKCLDWTLKKLRETAWNL